MVDEQLGWSPDSIPFQILMLQSKSSVDSIEKYCIGHPCVHKRPFWVKIASPGKIVIPFANPWL